MVNGYRPLKLGSNRSSDTGLNISFDPGYKSPSVGAQIGLGVVGGIFDSILKYYAADPTTRGSGGGTTMTAEEKAETIRQNQITGLYNII